MEKIFASRASCKWVKHYIMLVERAKCRSVEGYVERHHVVPRCMGGKDTKDNMVNLTPEEHYTAHLLLMKIFPDNGALARAAIMMCAESPTTPRSNKAYGWVRRHFAAHSSARMREWHQQNDHPMQGRKHTNAARAKISENWGGQIKKVYCFCPNTGKLVATYNSVREAATAVGRHPQTIYSCIRVPGKRTAAGLSWSYEAQSPGVVQLANGSKRVGWKLKEEDCRRAWAGTRARTDIWQQSDEIYRIVTDSPSELAAFAKNSTSSNTVYRIAQKIKKGWNPLTDNKWKEWKDGTKNC